MPIESWWARWIALMTSRASVSFDRQAVAPTTASGCTPPPSAVGEHDDPGFRIGLVELEDLRRRPQGAEVEEHHVRRVLLDGRLDLIDRDPGCDELEVRIVTYQDGEPPRHEILELR
jgi:hypothetical protein